jgi:acetyl esterase/lipase
VRTNNLRSLLIGTLFVVITASAQAQSVVHDVIYQKQGGAAFTMDVFKPAKPTGAALVFIVSGGWFSNHNDINPMLSSFFEQKGITVFQVVHGSQPKYQIPEILGLVTHAIRFVHLNASTYGIDPNRIAVMGASAGGHLSLMIAGTGDQGDPAAKDPVDRAPSTVKTVVAFFPPTDFLNWGGPGVMPFKMPQMKVFMPAFGITDATPIDQFTKLGQTLSPINKVTLAFPPTLLIHGDKDTLVPIQQSQIMDAALAKAGVKHKLIVVPGGGHGAETAIKAMPDALKWLEENL